MFDLPQYYTKLPAFDKNSMDCTVCWRYAANRYDYGTFNERLCQGKLWEEDIEKALKVFEKDSHWKTGDEPSVWPSLILTLLIGIGLFAYYIYLMTQTKQWWTLCFIVFYLFILSWLFALLYYIHIYMFHQKLLRREKAFMKIARKVNATLFVDKDVRVKVGYKSVTLIFELGWKIHQKALADKNVNNPWRTIEFK